MTSRLFAASFYLRTISGASLVSGSFTIPAAFSVPGIVLITICAPMLKLSRARLKFFAAQNDDWWLVPVPNIDLEFATTI